MYFDAQKELYGRECIEYEHGFVCFDPIFPDKSMYIQLLYVKPEHRKLGYAKEILRDLKKQFKVKVFSGFIDKKSGPYINTLNAHLKAGYEVVKNNEDSLIVQLDSKKLNKDFK